mmetsp:Transcript_48427/g.125634  ORF Transcript_48427/g.125634 Transcript_48427/m.125634 type:complete len:152 (-) Transcript_48427:235-690(-)
MQAGNLLAEPVLLSQLMNPQIFLNALRQECARRLQQPLDSLVLISAFEKSQLDSGNAPVASIENLFLQGASYSGQLMDAAADAPTLVGVPHIYVSFGTKSSLQSSGDSVSVPVYFDLRREKLLTELALQCGRGEQAKWILAGAALFISDEE